MAPFTPLNRKWPALLQLLIAYIAFVVLSGRLILGDQLSSLPVQITSPIQVRPAISPYIDAHVHFDDHTSNSALSMLQSMSRQNVTKVFLLVPPFTFDDPGRYEAEVLLDIAKQHPDKLAVVGGGGSLSAMLHQSVVLRDTGPEMRRKFKARAEEILAKGAIGFGEMTTEHFPSPVSPIYQYAPADHVLLKLLADIAAQHGVPIVLHAEAVPQDMALPSPLKSPPNPPRLHGNIAPLERLLDHNTNAKIIWAHAGSDGTGYRTAELCRRLLKAHGNLYMEIKTDPMDPGKNSVMRDGKIKSEWLKLFQDFPDRFIIGSDQHYPEPQGRQRWQESVQLLNQLSPDLRAKIGRENTLHIYNAKSN